MGLYFKSFINFAQLSFFLLSFFFGFSMIETAYDYFFIKINKLQLILWLSGVIFLYLALSFLGSRLKTHKYQLVVYVFILLVYIFINTNNWLVFFICYELFLLPSFIIVYFGSPNRRGVIASIYFLVWTQIGSFIVFLALLASYYSSVSFLISNLEITSFLSLLFFAGFGIKIPVWPAHYWLTKTHVEAPTYFSIYLSGFLVKTALYGLWVFCFSSKTFEIFNIAFIISVFGIIDASVKMWAQVDLKKMIAYATIQEMNLILVGLLFSSSTNIIFSGLFILAHTLLSTLFFLLTDSIYRRFGSRSTYNVRGLMTNSPNFGFLIYSACLFFAGAPFTLKFFVEIFIFSKLLELNFVVLLFVIFISNWVAIVSFSKNWFITLFGTKLNILSMDLTYREIIVYSMIFLFLIVLGFLTLIV